jgi:hypothetical protein
MDMVTCNAIAEQRNSMLVYSLSESSAIFQPVNSISQKVLAIVTTMREVINIPGQDISVGAWHQNLQIEEIGSKQKKGPNYSCKALLTLF